MPATPEKKPNPSKGLLTGPMYTSGPALGGSPVEGPTGGKSIPDPLGFVKHGSKKKK